MSLILSIHPLLFVRSPQNKGNKAHFAQSNMILYSKKRLTAAQITVLCARHVGNPLTPHTSEYHNLKAAESLVSSNDERSPANRMRWPIHSRRGGASLLFGPNTHVTPSPLNLLASL
jgi:hypothetical protein